MSKHLESQQHFSAIRQVSDDDLDLYEYQQQEE
jgi:hypothetical protein